MQAERLQLYLQYRALYRRAAGRKVFPMNWEPIQITKL